MPIDKFGRSSARDVVTKHYVGASASLIHSGLIPPLGEDYSKTWFTAMASSFFDSQHAPYMAFNPLLTGNVGAEWVTSGQGAGAWLQIWCPQSVRIWKIQLTGRRGDSPEQITSWNLAGSRDSGTSFTTVLTSNTPLDSTVQEFLVHIPAGTSYYIYRLNVLTARPTNPGISMFQIFPMIN